jgi:hypothetical protein
MSLNSFNHLERKVFYLMEEDVPQKMLTIQIHMIQTLRGFQMTQLEVKLKQNELNFIKKVLSKTYMQSEISLQ